MADSQSPSTSSSNSSASTTTLAVKRKRRRTRSHNSSPSPGRGFFVPGFENGGSGHKMMSMSELMDSARGVTNMYLAHEIAVDKDFMLEKLKPEVQPGFVFVDGNSRDLGRPTLATTIQGQGCYYRKT